MVAWYPGIGKDYFHTVGNTYAELPIVIQKATTFLLVCYGYPESRTMPDTRQKV